MPCGNSASPTGNALAFAGTPACLAGNALVFADTPASLAAFALAFAGTPASLAGYALAFAGVPQIEKRTFWHFQKRSSYGVASIKTLCWLYSFVELTAKKGAPHFHGDTPLKIDRLRLRYFR